MSTKLKHCRSDGYRVRFLEKWSIACLNHYRIYPSFFCSIFKVQEYFGGALAFESRTQK